MEKREPSAKRSENRGIAAIITIAVSSLALICCIFPSGAVFSAVGGFFLGILGVFSYILFSSLIIVSVLSLRGVGLKAPPKRAALLLSTFFTLLLAVQVISTLKQFKAAATMAEYLSAVYYARWTAGGLLTGIITYAFKAILSVWGSFALYVVVIVLLSLAMLDFSMFKRRREAAPEKPKEIKPFELDPAYVPREQPRANVGSGLYVSTIKKGGEQGAGRQGKQKERLCSEMDEQDEPPYAQPEDARSAYRDAPYGYKPPYAQNDAQERPVSGSGQDKKSIAFQTLFGGQRPRNAGVSGSNSVAAGTYSGSVILPNVTVAEPRPPVISEKPDKIFHDTSSLTPNNGFKSSVTPDPRNNFGVYADNPNDIISGDYFTSKTHKAGAEKANTAAPPPAVSVAAANPVIPAPAKNPVIPASARASLAPTALRSEPRAGFAAGDGYRTGIDTKAYAEFKFSARPEKADVDAEDKTAAVIAEPEEDIVAINEEDEDIAEEKAEEVISVYDDNEEDIEEIEDLTEGVKDDGEDDAEEEDTGSSFLRGLRPDPVITSERDGDGTGRYKISPPEPERTKIEEFEDKVIEIDKAFTETLHPAAAAGTDIVREPVRRAVLPRKPVKIDNQVKLIDYGAEVAKPERREPLLQPVPYTPPMAMLLQTQSTDYHDSSVDYAARRQQLESIMEEFKAPSKVIGVAVGPAVTRYELQTAQGISVKKIEGLAQDIAYKMACCHSVRIQSPIAGRQAVGIEIPNDKVAIVALKELIESREFQESGSPLTFAIGKDIAGKCIVEDLADMVHILIAGSTGSGKSACLNSLITSIVFKSTPDEVRLILIDPKRVEFNVYNGMPHLLLPAAVDEPEKAINAFQWAIEEMDRRYKLFQSLKVANILEFNASPEVLSGQENKIPYIVIVVDELADLMSFNKREMEEKIRRLAALARAAGIHLVIATQRPSVDVITGTIKTNLPSRIAFAVTNFADSKTILDQSGAENLLGRGDMLFCSRTMKEPIRVQGAFVTKAEVKAIVESVKMLNPSVYDEEAGKVINFVKAPEEAAVVPPDDDEDREDVLLGEAVKLAIENGQASTSMMQRRFSVGYARAARLIDQMELKKYISPFDGSKPRQVYITMSEWNDIFGNRE